MAAKKKAAATVADGFVDVGGYKRVRRERRDEIVTHINKVLKDTKDFSEIIKHPPPQANRGGGKIKLYDDDIDDILKAKQANWSIPEIVLLFATLKRPISYVTVQRVFAGKIQKGRGLRSAAEGK
jgi:hypothetical protein